MYISNMSKDELEKLMLDHFLHPFLEVRESALHGRGVFAKIDIPCGTRFEMHVLTKCATDLKLKRYTWTHDTICGGLGYFANGSCPTFEKNLGQKIGPYFCAKINVIADFSDGFFKTVHEIKKGDELILNYGDGYFFPTNVKTGKLDYSKLVV